MRPLLTLRRPGMPRGPAHLLTCALFLSGIPFCTQARAGQDSGAGSELSAAELQQLTETQQAALASGNTAAILQTSQHLAGVVLRLLGEVAFARGDAAAAVSAFTDSIAEDDQAGTRLDLARAYLTDGKPELALAESTKLTDADPQSAAGWRLAGESYLALKNDRAGLDALARSWRTGPAMETGLVLVTAEAEHAQAAQARLTAQEIVAEFGDSAQTHLLIAGAYHQADDLDGTVAELKRATAEEPQNGALHLAAGNAYWELNENQYNPDSLREFTAAQQLAPGDYFSNFDLGSILSQYHRYADAAPFLAQAASEDPSSPDPWLQLGMNAYAEHRTADARTALRKTVALAGAPGHLNDMESFRANLLLSILDAESNETKQAGEEARSAERLRAKLMAAGSGTVVTESNALLLSNAPSSAHAAAAARPGPSSAGYSPAQAALDDREKALRAVAANSLNDAGTALARNRDYAAALPFFRKAANADATLSPVMRNLGLAAFHTGHYAEAEAALSKAAAQDPGDALAKNYLEKAQAASAAAPQP